MPEYIVFVMPPSDEDAEPFDIPEWEFDAAMATAERYRAHGWKACIIDYGERTEVWSATGVYLPTLSVSARSADEAIIRARAVNAGYDGVQLELEG